MVNAADHRQQVRHEGYLHRRTRNIGETLLNFGQVPMTGDAVGLETVRHFAQQIVDLGLAARATDTGSRTGNQMIDIDHAGLQQRNETQLH